MTIYYNAKSRSLSELTAQQRQSLLAIFSDTHEMMARHAELKYRVKCGGQSLPIYGLRFGQGQERGSERLIYTYWDNKYIVLDFITAHDYHKAPSMDRGFMRSFFAELQSGAISIEEVDGAQEQELPQALSAESLGAVWVPASISHSGRLLAPTAQQQHLGFEGRSYPLILDGPAGSGKTLTLSLMFHALTTQPQQCSAGSKVVYVYPSEATSLQEKMQQLWTETYLRENSFNISLETRSFDSLLPEGLQSQALEALTASFTEVAKKATKKSSKKKTLSDSDKAWAVVQNSGVPLSLVLEYLSTLAVFKAYLPSEQATLSSLSERGGLSRELFQSFETLYTLYEDSLLAPLRAALQTPLEGYYLLVLDETQNMSFLGLAYLLMQQEDHRIVLSGDRNQAAQWRSLSALFLIDELLNRAQINAQYETLGQHYRCPKDVWAYIQQRPLALKRSLFGDEYRHSARKSGAENPVGFDNIFHLSQSEDGTLFLRDFLEQIPPMSPDCYVITQNLPSFDKLAPSILGDKRLIVLTPQQAAGLEVPTVIAFDPLDYHNLDNCQAPQKVKSRSRHLSAAEKKAYEELNAFYVSLSRCTQNALIVDRPPLAPSATREQLIQNLQRPPLSGFDYASYDPAHMLLLYHAICKTDAAQGQQFYERYHEVLEPLLEKKQSPQITPEPSPTQSKAIAIGTLVAEISKNPDNHWQQIDSTLLARLFFEPYGPKNKRCLWQRLLEQQQSTSSPVQENKVWQSFLKSSAASALITPDFYEISLPCLLKTVGEHLQGQPGYSALTEALVRKSAATCSQPLPPSSALSRLIELYHIKSDAVAPEFLPPPGLQKKGRLEGAKAVSQAAITPYNTPYTVNPSPQDTATGSKEELKTLTLAFVSILCSNLDNDVFITAIQEAWLRLKNYYIHNLQYSHDAAAEEIEKTIKRLCVIKKEFWHNLNAWRYGILKDITKNCLLFIEPCGKSDTLLDFDATLIQRYRSYNRTSTAFDFDTTRGILFLLEQYNQSQQNLSGVFYNDNSQTQCCTEPIVVLALRVDRDYFKDNYPEIKRLLRSDRFFSDKEQSQLRDALQLYHVMKQYSAAILCQHVRLC